MRFQPDGCVGFLATTSAAGISPSRRALIPVLLTNLLVSRNPCMASGLASLILVVRLATAAYRQLNDDRVGRCLDRMARVEHD
ncbi:MAG: hypothetical protein H6821_13190 [Planctomycetaceae bacterium]|nr:hypothetical protein [Planctomycetaceae bacterium]